ncbi:MAG: tetratricopeptide repeat protein, partial [Bacillota bacterium]
LAKTLFDEGSYAECLTALDQLDKTWPHPPGAADIPTAFVRALCLIRLEKLTDAANLLSQIESWPASPEQHARALFLTGWIHLQTDDRPKAISTFQRLIATYAQTSFAAKAKDLLTNLE